MAAIPATTAALLATWKMLDAAERRAPAAMVWAMSGDSTANSAMAATPSPTAVATTAWNNKHAAQCDLPSWSILPRW